MAGSISRSFLTPALLAPALLAAALGGCASGGRSQQADALERAQYAYSAAVRWGDMRGAWELQAPEWRQAHPLTDMQLERYRQLEAKGYRVVNSDAAGVDGAARSIDIELVNRNTMAVRNVGYRETWRWDAAAKRWWVTSGLPDYWNGQ